MHIKPSSAIRNNYNEIATLCKESGEPVYLTKNGEGDLVVMDITSYARRESMLRLREGLIAAEEDRLAGKKGISLDDLDGMMKKAIRETANGRGK